jgi:hypothetical protein
METRKYEERNGLSLFVPSYNENEIRSRKLRVKVVQNFDKEKIMVKKACGEFNVYDMIQEGLPDTEIYTVLEKYNCTVDEAKERMKGNLQKLQGVFDMNKSFVDTMQEKINAENAFNDLPLDVRDKFGNSLERFLKEGRKYVEEEIKKDQEAAKEQEQLMKLEGETENV